MCVCVCVLRTTLADALIAGRRFLQRHINHIPTLHTHTRQAANTIAQWENKKNLHDGNSTNKSSSKEMGRTDKKCTW